MSGGMARTRWSTICTQGWYGNTGQKSPKWKPENLGELSEKDVMNVLELIRKEFAIDADRTLEGEAVRATVHSVIGDN